MAKFRDADGREWAVRLTLGALPRLKDAGLDLSAAVQAGALDIGGLDDPDTLGRVLWVLLEPQAEKAGYTPERLAGAMDGPAIYAARLAFAEALADFSHPPEVAAALRRRIPAAAETAQRRLIAALETETATDSPATGSSGGGGSSPG